MTAKLPMAELDELLHQPVRTRITALLSARGNTTFTELKQTLEITDGNLEAHMKKLLAAEYVKAKKVYGRVTGSGRPQTFYSLTRKGKSAFKRYITSLETLFAVENFIKNQAKS